MQALKDREEKDQKKIKDAQEYVTECKDALKRRLKSLENISAERKEWAEQMV